MCFDESRVASADVSNVSNVPGSRCDFDACLKLDYVTGMLNLLNVLRTLHVNLTPL